MLYFTTKDVTMLRVKKDDVIYQVSSCEDVPAILKKIKNKPDKIVMFYAQTTWPVVEQLKEMSVKLMVVDDITLCNIYGDTVFDVEYLITIDNNVISIDKYGKHLAKISVRKSKIVDFVYFLTRLLR